MLKLSGDPKLISYVQRDEVLGWDQEGPVGCTPSALLKRNQEFLFSVTVRFLTHALRFPENTLWINLLSAF